MGGRGTRSRPPEGAGARAFAQAGSEASPPPRTQKDHHEGTQEGRPRIPEFLKALALGAGLPAVTAPLRPDDSARAGRYPRPRLDGTRVDVLVGGGGPAGIGAALAAARAGAETLLIENHAFFGGVAAWCLGIPIDQMRPVGRPRSKIHELVIGKLRAYGDQALRTGTHQLWCNVDDLKVAVLDALDEVGCGYLVHTQAVDAIVEGDRVAGVVAATKDGLARILTKAVVDATGDADVAYFAGAETMKARGSLSPITLCLRVTNVDPAK